MTKKSTAAQAAIPASAIEALTAGTLPSALATSKASQAEQTAQVMESVAQLTGEPAARTAK